MQRTLVLLKPDAVQRGLSGEIISRLERRGLKLVAVKMMHVGEDLARRHYSPHVGKPFFEGLLAFITSLPIIAMILEGDNAIETVRGIMGATNPEDATPGTIRRDLALSIELNLIHGSDSESEASREIDLFFSPAEILEYVKDPDRWATES